MILCLTDKLNKDTISSFFQREDIILGIDNYMVDEIDALIFDERTPTKKLYTFAEKNPAVSLYAYFDKEIFDLRNEKIINCQKNALANKEWWKVKDLNKIKVRANIIRKNDIFDTYPLMLQVESTSFCNAKCIMCSHYYKDIKEGAHLSFDRSIVLEEVLPYVETVMLHGIGEPFLNPDIIKWLDFYKSFDVHLSTFTNMSVLTSELIEAIGRSFSALHISCDGCRKETFEHIRGNLKFDTFVNNVKRLHNAFPDIKLHMHVVAMRQNLDEIDEFVLFAKELGFSSLTFSNLTINPLIRNDGDSLREFPTMAKRKFNKAKEIATQIEFPVNYPNEYDRYIDDDITYLEEKKKYDSQERFNNEKKLLERVANIDDKDLYATEIMSLDDIVATDYHCEGLCDWLAEYAYMDLEGNLAVCCSKYYITMGNISEFENFGELWNSPQYRKMRRMFFDGNIPMMCQGCRYIVDDTLKNLQLLNYNDDFLKVKPIGELYNKLSD